MKSSNIGADHLDLNNEDKPETSGRHTIRRNQVLDAAMRCFVEKGFHKAGIAEIADQAQMSPGHIYHYFKNKGAIITAIVKREGDEALLRIKELEALPRENFAELFIQHFEEGIKNRLTAFQTGLNFEIISESRKNPDVAAQLKSNDERIRNLFSEIFREKLDLQNPGLQIDALLTLMVGISTRYARNPERTSENLGLLLRTVLLPVLNMTDAPRN